jgi:imidazoleglycerol-phosphate dehydratase / histidinol-phosphatase
MYKLILDKEFFDLDKDISYGLVSGLKTLARRGFAFEVNDFKLTEDDKLFLVLKSEGVFLNRQSINNKKIFVVAAKKSADKNAIIVSSKSDIKNFEQAVNVVLTKLRTAVKKRKTKETDISIEVSLDGKGESKIDTGIGFFDHMLEQIARHGNINLRVAVKGDLNVDEHHTVEDVGIALGTAISEALGEKVGIKRYGFYLPMDDSIARCALDLGGRSYLNFKCKFSREKVGEFPTELTEEFFRGISGGLKANVYIRAKGDNDHHKIESIFKVFAKSLNEACRADERSEGILPSTKGTL